MAQVTFPLNELAMHDLSLGERIEDEIRGVLRRYEPADVVVECRITLQAAGADPALARIGIKLSAAGTDGQPGWARAFGLPLDGAAAWLEQTSLERVLGVMEAAPIR
jgi:hypothetical protein